MSKTVIYRIKNLSELESLIERVDKEAAILRSTLRELKEFEIELEATEYPHDRKEAIRRDIQDGSEEFS